MMHEEDVRPQSKKSHAYHLSITYNGYEFFLLTPPAILALPKCIFKGWRLCCMQTTKAQTSLGIRAV